MAKDKEKYKIEMTSKQMDVMRSALEFYSRFLSGQVDHLPSELEKHMYSSGSPSRWDPETQMAFYNIKKTLFKELTKDLGMKETIGVSYGVGNSPIRETDLAYEMYREILVFREKENPTDGYSVYQRETMKVSAEPLMDIKDVTRESKIEKVLNDELNIQDETQEN